jgi:hypothetical protein
MKKYKIVHKFPDRYRILKRVFLFFWVDTVFKWGKMYYYDSYNQAIDDVEKLKISGKEVGT